MSPDADPGGWRVTTDRGRIVDWAEAHDAVPMLVEQPDGSTDLAVETDPEGTDGERVDWDEFFRWFRAERRAFRYRSGPAAGDGPACEIVARDELPDREAADEKAEHPDAAAAEQIGASDTGEGEPVIYDRVEDEGAAGGSESASTDAATDTPMAESAADAEAAGLVLDEISEHHAGPGSSVEDEHLVFANSGDRRLDLSGWTVVNDEGRSFTFPEGLTLAPGERVTVHSGEGASDEGAGDESDLHWGASEPIWDEQGDTVAVVTPDDRVVLREPYRDG